MPASPTFPARLAFACVLLSVSGCATLTGSSTQTIDLSTLDARNRPLRGVTCTLTHGPGSYVVDTPVTGLEIQRSSTDLEIECRRGSQVARGTVVAHAESSIAYAFIPGGSLATLVDHATGAMYTYPSPLQLRIGQHLRFEVSPTARSSVVADSEMAPPPAERTSSASGGAPKATAAAATRQPPSPQARRTTDPATTAATP